ncbi:MAG: GIY-YIG nuclease family protein [Anaerolineaceae bacterium]|nr:GIY-YIG nuclease family protein [Anaerolineaceae bacterium]
MNARRIYVYILSSATRTLYCGVTDDLKSRLSEYKDLMVGTESPNQDLPRLVYVEEFDDEGEAVRREKQIQKWRRSRKIDLIMRVNPKWVDIRED